MNNKYLITIIIVHSRNYLNMIYLKDFTRFYYLLHYYLIETCKYIVVYDYDL